MNGEFPNGASQRGRFMNKRIAILALLFLSSGAVLAGNRLGYFIFPRNYTMAFEVLVIAVVSFLAVSLFIKFTENRVFRFFEKELEIEGRIFLTKIYTSVLYIAAAFFVFSQLGLTTQNIMIYFGFLTTGLAVSLQDLLKSYLIWLIVLLKRPFRIGDHVTIDQVSGKIVRIGTYYITLKSEGDETETLVKLPMKILLDKPIVNHGSGGLVSDHTDVYIKTLPADMERRLRALSGEIGALLDGGSVEETTIEGMDGAFRLTVKYIVPFDSRSRARTGVTLLLSRKLGKFLRKK